eukprot:TRINITY_DN994_c0_g1_i16.p1 TRINITY_DN994_c0_g1~~TRINITY_DN994_c0_g1_i16.p1  ORF type:complete len:126 (+),score=19.27 TRINITY_DN994_c0_g1_i16:238-615(+)
MGGLLRFLHRNPHTKEKLESLSATNPAYTDHKKCKENIEENFTCECFSFEEDPLIDTYFRKMNEDLGTTAQVIALNDEFLSTKRALLDKELENLEKERQKSLLNLLQVEVPEKGKRNRVRVPFNE